MKPLTLRIAEHVIQHADPTNPLAHRAVMVIYRSDIQDAVERGCSLLSIWKTLSEEGVVNFGYQAFRRYARVLIIANSENR
ncbi:MAG: TraK family protein [Janthinobacterium lividum]